MASPQTQSSQTIVFDHVSNTVSVQSSDAALAAIHAPQTESNPSLSKPKL